MLVTQCQLSIPIPPGHVADPSARRKALSHDPTLQSLRPAATTRRSFQHLHATAKARHRDVTLFAIAKIGRHPALLLTHTRKLEHRGGQPQSVRQWALGIAYEEAPIPWLAHAEDKTAMRRSLRRHAA